MKKCFSLNKKALILKTVLLYSTGQKLRKMTSSTNLRLGSFWTYLRVQIDPSLNWKEQINVAIGKISRGIGMLKYSERYLSLQTIQRMYFSIVDSHFRYCCCVWGCAGDTTLRKLQKLQNQAARVVTNSLFDHKSLPLISKLGWLTVKEMIEFETACMVYKALHGLAPPYMKSIFHKLSESCNRTLRNTSTDHRIPL